MRTKGFSRSWALLLELVAAIALFAVAAGICGRVLIFARTLSAEAEALNRGVEQVTAAAELLRAADDEEAALARLAREEALEIQRQEQDGLIRYRITFLSGDEALYSLELVKSQEAAP